MSLESVPDRTRADRASVAVFAARWPVLPFAGSLILHLLAIYLFMQVWIFVTPGLEVAPSRPPTIFVRVNEMPQNSAATHEGATPDLSEIIFREPPDEGGVQHSGETAESERGHTQLSPTGALSGVFQYIRCRRPHDPPAGGDGSDAVSMPESLELETVIQSLDCQRVIESEGDEVQTIVDPKLALDARIFGWVVLPEASDPEWMVIVQDGKPRDVGREIFGPMPWEK